MYIKNAICYYISIVISYRRIINCINRSILIRFQLQLGTDIDLTFFSFYTSVFLKKKIDDRLINLLILVRYMDYIFVCIIF